MEELVVKIEQNAVLSNNLDTIKKEMTEMMAIYDGVTVTEDTIDPAKKDLAEIRKIKEGINDIKKDIKKAYMKPYEDFEKQIKEVMAIADKPIELIDSQLKALDKKRVDEKQDHLKELWEQGVGELADILPFEKIKKPQWDNKSYTDKAIMADISEKVAQAKIDLTTIKSLGSEIEDTLIEIYKDTGLPDAIKKHTDYLNTKQLVNEKIKEEQAAEKVERVRTKDTAVFEIHGESDVRIVRDFLFKNDIDYEER